MFDAAAIHDTIFLQNIDIPRILQCTYLHGLLYLHWFQHIIQQTIVLYGATHRYNNVQGCGNAEQNNNQTQRPSGDLLETFWRPSGDLLETFLKVKFNPCYVST